LIFEPTPIPGAFLVELERKGDARGFFARSWCRKEFTALGLDADMVQASISHNAQAGTVRGIHFQWPPSQEAKLVRCERGRVFDVLVDLRPDSPAFQMHFGQVLDDARRNALLIPPGVGHGFQTLVPDCDVFYMMTDYFRPDLADGVRFDDPAFGIKWPERVTAIIDRDRQYPNFNPERHARRYAAARVPD
jgi:dTDP-4-dehydrorhamnose 3,5-epimerase